MGLAISASGVPLYAAENRGDALAVIDLVSAAVQSVPVGSCDEQGTPVGYPATAPQCQPYGVALSVDGRTAYVSNWGEHSVTAISTVTRTAVAKDPGRHPPERARHQPAGAQAPGAGG